MSFINVNKVTLEGGNGDIRKDLADVMLLTASLIYDAIKEGIFDDALNLIGLLQSATKNVKYAIDNKQEDLYKDTLEELSVVNVKLIEKDSKGKEKETIYDKFILYGLNKDNNHLCIKNANTEELLMLSKMLDLKVNKRLKQELE